MIFSWFSYYEYYSSACQHTWILDTLILIRILYGKFEAIQYVWRQLHKYGTECQPQAQEAGHGHNTRWWRGRGDQRPGNGQAQGLGHPEAAVCLPGEHFVDLLEELSKLLTIAISLFCCIKQFRHHSPSSSLKLIV